jgi:hypothetical protein
MENDAAAMKESIERVAGSIFDVLYHQGDMELRELRKRVDATPELFDMAIGALVDKDDIQLVETGDSVTVHRADPAPAVFPFRSN